ncbi:MAG: hypothetical protein RIR25_1795 [Verrucomicrobiota bacterium]
MNPKPVQILLGFAVAAIVAVLVLLPPPQSQEQAKPAPPEPKAPASLRHGSTAENFGPMASETHKPEMQPPAASAGSEQWENLLDGLLTSAGSDTAKTVRGLTLNFASLPPEAQEEFIAHAVNLCEDEQYSLLEGIYLNNATPAEVKDTIFNDLLNRPDEIKLPLLAKSLANPAHPMAADSREILEMYLEVEAGSVPPEGWEAAVKKYLATQRASEPAH